MQDILVRLVDVPIARMFVLAAIIFLLVAVLGRIEGKIEPGKIGRIGATIVGMLLMGSGLAMHFIDAETLRDKLNSEAGSGDKLIAAALAAGKPAVAPPGPVSMNGITGGDKRASPAIKVVSGTYGRNCGAKNDNATAYLARRCDGQTACEYTIEQELEDGSAGCVREFVAEWKCGSDEITRSVFLPPGKASREGIRLACGYY